MTTKSQSISLEGTLPLWYIIIAFIFSVTYSFVPSIIGRTIPVEMGIDVKYLATIARLTTGMPLVVYIFGLMIILIKRKQIPLFGKSFLLINLFLIVAYIRYYYELVSGEKYSASAVSTDVLYASIGLCLTLFPAVFFSYAPIEQFKKNTYKWILIYLSVIAILLCFYWHKPLMLGYSFRVIPHSQPVSPTYISVVGAYLSIMSFWCWSEKKIPLAIFFLVYIPGIILLYFGVSRAQMVALLMTHIVVIICSNKKSNILFWITIVGLILCHAGAIKFIGSSTPLKSNQTRGSLERITTMANEQKILFSIVNEMKNEGMNSFTGNNALNDEKFQKVTKVTDDRSSGKQSANNQNRSSDKQSTNNQDLIKKFGTGRGRLWLDSIHRIIQNPLLGYGLSPYKKSDPTNPKDLPKIVIASEPHNIYLQAFLATGVFGGTLFLIICFIGLRDSIACLRFTPEYGWLAILFLFFCIEGMFWRPIFGFTSFWIALIALRANAKDLQNKNCIREENATNM